ncbi:hypothetical protein Godav_025873 [Gossypium davidsonii]|uniref:Reverse transcriptase Ty1/copia-type domain-containing protein n=2 Tax=Gossypium TaxID=3633 RepID=A0A7J8TCX6_GOSDV|nr:hypothetical protein [Gossypium davidsonii]MBA0666696.1 hypothetical protein [Gossypium klotzschianum]
MASQLSICGKFKYLWKRLETLYATKFLANRLVLKQRLYTFRINESEHLKGHIGQFITLLNDLKNVEVQIDNEGYYCAIYPLHISLSGRP